MLPKVRAAIEHNCDLVAEGKAKLEDVIDHALSIFQRKFQFYCENINVMDSLFVSSGHFTKSASSGSKLLSRCGQCSTYMKLIKMPTLRLFCTTCDETYLLPRKGIVQQYEGHICPLDGFGLVLYSKYSLGKRKKQKSGGRAAFPSAVPLCPNCYNRPPFEGIEEMSCSDCLNASCSYSLIRSGVCPCPDSIGKGVKERKRRGLGSSCKGTSVEKRFDGCDGSMVLDAGAISHKDWKISCNRCQVMIRIHNVSLVKICNEKCNQCNASILNVTFTKTALSNVKGLKKVLQAYNSKTKGTDVKKAVNSMQLKFELNERDPTLKNVKRSYKGCLICDDVLNAQTELFRGRARAIVHSALVKDNPKAGGRRR